MPSNCVWYQGEVERGQGPSVTLTLRRLYYWTVSVRVLGLFSICLYLYRYLRPTRFLYLLAADESHPVTKLPPPPTIHLPAFTNEELRPRVSS